MTASGKGTSPTKDATLTHPVVLVGMAMVAVQVAVRAWASSSSWFFFDDLDVLSRLYRAPLTLHELLTPHDSQFMPGGILASWVVANSGTHNWALAAWILVGMQAIASASCLLMLAVVFGKRWAVLLLLTIYLASPMTLTAYMWWVAAINQVPLHTSFFLSVAAFVTYFRTRRTRYLLLGVAAIAFGMLFYVKAALIIPVVIGVAVLFFADCTPDLGFRRKFVGALQRHALLAVILCVTGSGYAFVYLNAVDSPLASLDVSWGPLIDNYLRIGFGPTLIGGPWRWWNPIPPTALVNPPDWAVTCAWVLIACLALRLWQTRRAHWRALLILAGYLATDLVLLATGRAYAIGDVVATELRYLADATPVAVLCLGLLVLGVDRPSPETTSRVDFPDLLRLPRQHRTLALVPLLLAGSVLSTVTYVHFWHADYNAKAYVANVASDARDHDLRVVDTFVPPEVMSPIRFPANYVSYVLRPLPNVHAETAGNDLMILDDDGLSRRAEVDPAVVSGPGPVEGCGYPVRRGPTTIDLRAAPGGDALEPSWWVSIDYFAGGDAELDLRLGQGTEGEATTGSGHYPVLQGLHQLLVRGEGQVDRVRLVLDDPDVALCVSEVSVGEVQVWQPE